MPSATNMMPAIRACAFRPRARRPHNAITGFNRPACRTFAEEKKAAYPSQGAVGPNMKQQEHVSEEAAKMAEIQGKEGPDVEGQGTPVQEILKEDKEARQQAPKVMKEQAKAGATTKPSTSTGTRSFSTSARQRAGMDVTSSSGVPLPPSMVPSESQRAQYASELQQSSTGMTESKSQNEILGLPEKIPNRKKRYEDIVDQLTNLMMRDGKKSVAQRNMAVILSTLRTSPAPTYSPTRALLPGTPPAQHLPLNPVAYLQVAVESVAPLLRLRSLRGAAGGGMALQLPVPMNIRQRRRQAFMWILDAVEKKQNRGSGRDTFAHRVAAELISVVEGKSSIWTKRDAIHKLATTARSNLNTRRKR